MTIHSTLCHLMAWMLIGLTASPITQAQTFPQGAAGTPLPAKTNEAAKNWTPELKAQIDALLEIKRKMIL